MKKLKMWFKSGTHTLHACRIIQYLTVLIFILTATILTPKKLASQPPPLVVSITQNSADCHSMSGEIIVDITIGSGPFWIHVTKKGGFFNFHQKFYTTPPFSVSIPDLDAGQYLVNVTGVGSSSFFQTVNMDDNAVWPINCWTNDKVYGVDIVNDGQENVYATGYFNGLLEIVPGSSQQMNSMGLHNIYLAKFTKCGKLLWETPVGQANADCFVKAIAMDKYENHIIMVGEIYPGNAIFQGNPSIVLSNTGTEKMAFIAKFDKSSGDILWATPIKSYLTTGASAQVTAEAVVTDNDGRIYVFGDFAGQSIELYSASGGAPSIGNNTSFQYRDNYLCVYKLDGGFLSKEIANVSSQFDEKAYGIDCIQSLTYPYDYEIYVTGLWYDNRFLLHRYTYPTLGFTKRTEFFIIFPQNIYYTPKSVKCFHYQNGTQIGISVSGWKNQWNQFYSQNFKLPFMATTVVFTGIYPLIAGMNYYEFVNLSPNTNNFSTNLDINRTNLDHYMVGCINEAGDHPVSSNIIPINYPPAGSYIWNDFFINKLSWVPASFDQNEWALWSNSPASGIFYHQQADLPVFAITSDDDGKAYFTGTYRDNLHFAQPSLSLSSWPGIFTAFIGRTYENSNMPIIKRDLQPANTSKNEISQTCELQLYPNPVTDFLTLIIGDHSDSELEISVFNTQGLQVANNPERISSEELLLDLSGLSAGIYLIRLRTGAISCSQKFVKN